MRYRLDPLSIDLQSRGGSHSRVLGLVLMPVLSPRDEAGRLTPRQQAWPGHDPNKSKVRQICHALVEDLNQTVENQAGL